MSISHMFSERSYKTLLYVKHTNAGYVADNPVVGDHDLKLDRFSPGFQGGMISGDSH